MNIFMCNTNCTTEKTSAMNYNVPLLPLSVLLIQILFVVIEGFSIIARFVPRLKSFLQSDSFIDGLKIRAEKFLSDSSELSHDKNDDKKPVSEVKNRVLDRKVKRVYVRREEAEMAMENLNLFCSAESEQLSESLSCDELSKLFEENEPSLEELKESFDVFDENRDGFVDAQELQRVLRLLGLSQGSDIDRCKRMIHSVDTNGDEKIDFHEFVKFMETIFC